MSASCSNCKSPVSPFDAYCAICGTSLVSLRWRLPEGGWSQGDARVAVRSGARSARIEFANEGSSPAALVLRRESLTNLPDWIDCSDLQDTVLPLLPGPAAAQSLEIPFDRLRLDQYFQPREGAPEAQVLTAQLQLLTSLIEPHAGGWRCRPLAVTLVLARKPRSLVGAAHYRFLPLEMLAGEGFIHRLTVANDSAEAMEVLRVEVRDDPASVPPTGYQRLDAEQVVKVHLPPAAERLLQPTRQRQLDLRATLSPEQLPAGTQGWLAAQVDVIYRLKDRPRRLRSRISAAIVRGPAIEPAQPADADPLTISFEGLRRDHVRTLRNPGDLPVAVEALTIERRRDDVWEPAPADDWLVVSGLQAGEELAPGEERQLHFRLVPHRRGSDEIDQEWYQRRLRLRHDGWQPGEEQRELTISVDAELGRVEEKAVGVDFGTSSSVVCIAGTRKVFTLPLEPEIPRIALASLMFFEGLEADGSSLFYFGDKAYSSADIDPTNLVRSIKRVVAQEPGARYDFLWKNGGNSRLLTWTAQQLLDRFVAELRARAETGVFHLEPEQNADLRLRGGRVVFRRAVFSHPVEVAEEMRTALMKAAHGAGLNRQQDEVDVFFTASCVDEASAAVLAYVDARDQGLVAKDVPLLDLERVLCFDMGGGTTDVAAVEVHGLASFAANPGQVKVRVTLCSNTGDSHFGGDDLDALVAEGILQQVEARARAEDGPLALNEVRHALRARSFSEFAGGYYQRSAITGGAQGRAEDRAFALFQLANKLRRAAEAAKIELSTQPTAKVTLPAEGWPRAASRKGGDPLEVEIRREEFEQLVKPEVHRRSRLLDRVVQRAGWEWPQVTTLLFTGQSVRVPVIRDEVTLHVMAERGDGAEPLIVVEPDQGLDPKHCVAIGAALWEASRQEGNWLQVESKALEQLLFDLQLPAGRRRFTVVPGLQAGTAIGTQVTLPATGASELILYRDEQPYVRFRGISLSATELQLQVEGPADFLLEADGQKIRGEIVQ